MFNYLFVLIYYFYVHMYDLIKEIKKIFFVNNHECVLRPLEKKPNGYKNINSSSLQIYK